MAYILVISTLKRCLQIPRQYYFSSIISPNKLKHNIYRHFKKQMREIPSNQSVRTQKYISIQLAIYVLRSQEGSAGECINKAPPCPPFLTPTSSKFRWKRLNSGRPPRKVQYFEIYEKIMAYRKLMSSDLVVKMCQHYLDNSKTFGLFTLPQIGLYDPHLQILVREFLTLDLARILISVPKQNQITKVNKPNLLKNIIKNYPILQIK